MIRSICRTHDGTIQTDLEPTQFADALQDTGGLLWVDLVAEPKERCELILHDTFGFHPLAVDDALEETHVPKVDDWGEYLYLVLRAILFHQGDEDRLREFCFPALAPIMYIHRTR